MCVATGKGRICTVTNSMPALLICISGHKSVVASQNHQHLRDSFHCTNSSRSGCTLSFRLHAKLLRAQLENVGQFLHRCPTGSCSLNFSLDPTAQIIWVCFTAEVSELNGKYKS